MKRPRVLIVDDEVLLGQTLVLALDETCDVELESSGEAAWQRLERGDEFDVIFCDLGLPDVSGIEIYRRFVARTPDATDRFVLITGGAVTEEARNFIDSHAGPLLQKPFLLADVERIVNEIAAD